MRPSTAISLPRAALALALAAVLALAAPAFAAEPPAGGIVLRQAACVENAQVTLGEVADPYGAVPPELWRRLSGVALFAAPAERGETAVRTVDDMQRILSARLGPAARGVSVPGSLTVQRGGFVLTTEEMEQRIVGFLTERVRALPGEAQVGDVNPPRTVFLPDDYRSLALEPAGPVGPGRVTLRLKALTADGRVLRQMQGTAFVDLWTNVACAARPVNPGEAVTPDAVTFVRKNLARLRGAAWDGTGGPFEVRSPVGAEQVIYADNLQPVALVKKGDRVSLVYRNDHFRLEVPAEALADGGFGDRIPVKNVETERQVMATVWDKNTVHVR